MRFKKRTERDDQNAVCQYLKLRYPKLLFFSDIAGDTAPRTVHAARTAKGFPDLLIFRSIIDSKSHLLFCGLAVELKGESARSRVANKEGLLYRTKRTLYQDKMHKQFRQVGWLCGFSIGSKAACKIIDDYMKLFTLASSQDKSTLQDTIEKLLDSFNRVRPK